MTEIEDDTPKRKLFLGWIYDWQSIHLSVTHPDWEPGAKVLVGKDDDGNRVVTTKIVKFTRKTVETDAGRWRLGVAASA
jgi:hypothetical protein